MKIDQAAAGRRALGKAAARWAFAAMLGFGGVAACSAADSPTTAPSTSPATQPSAADNGKAGSGATVGSGSTASAGLPPVIVSAERIDANLQDVPQSIRAFGPKELQDADVRRVDDIAYRTPNLLLNRFSVDRLSFPFIRGIGSGRNSPAVTTYYDDVPQLSFATSNIEFLDVDRVEVLRGPQGTLYGRNTLGGVINVFTRAPSNTWEADASYVGGTYALNDTRFAVRGPLVKDQASISLAGGYMTRNGYTENDFRGDRVDDKDHLFGRAEIRLTPTDRWDIRIFANGERDRDGDYALGDLASIIARPRHVSRDFEGFSDRDVWQSAAVAKYRGDAVQFTSITALQHWRSQDVTDLDYTPADLLRRNNSESEQSFIQEFRLNSPMNKPLQLNNDLTLSWVGGLFFFETDANQNAYNQFRPGAVGVIPGIAFPFKSFDTADIGTYGLSAYGQATLSVHKKLDFTAGLRYDYEHAKGNLGTFSDSTFIPATSFQASDDFDQISPRGEIDYHINDQMMAYASVAKGFKAGGFNPQFTPGNEHFGAETSWTYEAGIKTSWFNNRLRVNAAYYYIDWDHMQLDVPTATPAVFFIQNAGSATSHGLELDLSAILLDDYRGVGRIEVDAGAGIMNTDFGAGTMSGGVDVGGNRLPYAPDFTYHAALQYSHALSAVGNDGKFYARAEVFGVGRYFYDATEAREQDSYSLVSFRVGVGGSAANGKVNWRVEAFADNAFNEQYVPLAFPYGFAASGYVGENGAPQTFGFLVGVSY